MQKIDRRKFMGVAAGTVAGTAGAALGCSEPKSSAVASECPSCEPPGPPAPSAPLCPELPEPKPEPPVPEGMIREPARNISIMLETDVLVLGGGPAGLSAALAAAREGVSTAIVERYGSFGGVISQNMMGSIAWYRYADTIDSGGVRLEIEQRAKELGASIDIFSVVENSPLSSIAEQMGLIVDGESTYEILDAELFKHVADAMLLEAGVVPLLHCAAVEAIMDGNTIRGVITESKSGRQAILARRVIDATGDADIAFRAGAPIRPTPKSELMEATTNFGCSNVKLFNFMVYTLWKNGKMGDWASETSGKEADMFSTHLFEPFEKAKAAGEIPADIDIRAFPGCFTEAGEVLSLNAIHFHGFDGANVRELTWAEMEGRKRARMAMDALRKYAPGFENARLRNFGAQIGVRETRKIVGEYNITEHDVKNQAAFTDSIGICPEFIDGYGVLYLPTTGRYFQVPYGITVPERVENLLVAGRCVAGDRISHAATRQMVCCSVTGQGAGVAAAQSIKDDVTCRQVNITRVQQRLVAQGVTIS